MSGFADYSLPPVGQLQGIDRTDSWARPMSFAAVSGSGEGERAAAGLSLRMSAPGEFRVAICCGRGRPLMELGPFGDYEVVAVWRHLSERSGLPFVVAAESEVEEAVAPAVTLQPTTDRRKRLAVLAARRPRFLCRRKTTRLPRSPLVHRGPEIAGGADR